MHIVSRLLTHFQDLLTICSMQDYTVSNKTSTASATQTIISDTLIVLMGDSKLNQTTTGIQEVPFNFSPSNRLSSTSPSFSRPRSCFKARRDHVQKRKYLPPYSECHVHFNAELDPRWSNGARGTSQPLQQPVHRRDSIC